MDQRWTWAGWPRVAEPPLAAMPEASDGPWSWSHARAMASSPGAGSAAACRSGIVEDEAGAVGVVERAGEAAALGAMRSRAAASGASIMSTTTSAGITGRAGRRRGAVRIIRPAR